MWQWVLIREQRKNLGCLTVGDLFARVESSYLNVRSYLTFDIKKCHFHKLLKICLTFSTIAENLVTLQSYKQIWLKDLSTNMVINHCTLYKQVCMIHHFNQNVTADAKMYHTWLYVKCKIIYDHICTQFWRSVSAVGHGNVILKSVDLASRVRSRPAQRDSLCDTNFPKLHSYILLLHWEEIGSSSIWVECKMIVLIVVLGIKKTVVMWCHYP